MATRKLPQEAEKIFNKYTQNFVMRLKKEDALTMFTTDFKLSNDQAEVIFDLFDKDKNGQLSQWEYKQFYLTVGESVHELFEIFERLEVEKSGFADIDKTWDVLKEVKTSSGGVVKDQDLEMYIKTAAGENKKIDFLKFINVFCRIKQSRG